jgi:hypothetical protein
VQLIHDELAETRNTESSADVHDDSQQDRDDPRLN